MGQMADDMVEGVCCELCGQYFQGKNENELHAHGYPVVCWECWPGLTKKEKKQHQKALRPTV